MKGLRTVAGVVLLLGLSVWLLRGSVPGRFIGYLFWSLKHGGEIRQGSVENGDTRIYYTCYGTGRPVLLLHGGLSNRLSWFSQIPWLVNSGCRVIVPDVRGHGFSMLGTRSLNYGLLAEDAFCVLDELSIGQADVVGWSDGGNTALLMALNHPERIGRLVTISANVDPSGLVPGELAKTYVQSSGTAYWLKRWWTGAGRHLGELERRVKQMWRNYPNLTPEELHSISMPVLVMIGEHDIIRLEHAREMTEEIPNSEFKVVSGGHASPATHPDAVNAAIAAFYHLPEPEGSVCVDKE